MNYADTPEGRAFIAALAKDAVIVVAPEEMELFDEMVAEYFDDPTPPDPDQQASDDALGFGLDAILVAATPAATAMASVVVGYLVNEVIDATLERSIEPVLRRLFKRSDDSVEAAPQLTPQQLAAIKARAIEQAEAFGMEPAEAERMANAMIGSLLTA